ncbi:hypothetical protein N9Y42_08835 [Mariniblastus sp.]|nr:hypothetical protein [Mariniblastus sp.]
MQIELPKDIEALIQQRAAAAGFPGEIAAYVAHLVKADATEDFGGPEHLSIVQNSKADLDAKIDAGFSSGPASPMNERNWQELHDRIDGRQPKS